MIRQAFSPSELSCLGTPTRTVRHLRFGRWLHASEGFAMTNRTAIHPRLHSLIGDVAADVPGDLAREIECALNEQNLPTQSATFFARLNAINHADGEDGQPCISLTLGASNHASLRRSLSGLGALLDLLQAADHARNEGGPDEQLGAFHIDGLIVAARQLVREAHHCLSSGDA